MSTSSTNVTPIVEITWLDAASAPGWGSRSRIQDNLSGLVRCKTVGYLCGVNAQAVSLYQTTQENPDDDVAEILSIPRSCVESVLVLTPDAAFTGDDFPFETVEGVRT